MTAVVMAELVTFTVWRLQNPTTTMKGETLNPYLLHLYPAIVKG